MQALSTAAPGKVYTIKWMFGLPEVLDIIRNCQIEEGSEIRVFENSFLKIRHPRRTWYCGSRVLQHIWRAVPFDW